MDQGARILELEARLAAAENALRERDERTARDAAMLAAELQHRARNILTIVRSVLRRSIETARDPADVVDHFQGRLAALARTYVVVINTTEGWVDLENLIRDELLSVGISDGPNVRISGPDVPLPPKTAGALGLAVHELTTNALKYGALRGDRGDLEIAWRLNVSYRQSDTLELIWNEKGVPLVPVAPVHEGFGREFIEKALPYQIGAETQIEFLAGGVRCRISFPLADGKPEERPAQE